MRSIGIFSDELHFPSGFQLSGAFTVDECRILECYGLTMKGLQEGTLMPASTAEHFFLAELDGEFSVSSDFAKCWRKYSKKVARCDLRPAINRKSRRSSSAIAADFADAEVLILDIDDSDLDS